MSMPYVPDAYGGSAPNGNGKAPVVPPQYPQMPAMPDTKPLLDALGATGVAIMSGIVTSEEYNPDWFWRDGVHIVEQMLRNDGQIAAVREMVELPIRSATWSIKPASEDPRDAEIAAMVQSALFDEMCYTTASGRNLTQKWDDILRQILLFIPYGFMVFELNYREDDGWIKWSRWTPLLPRTVYRWWVGPDTELAGIQQWTWMDYGYHFVDIPADKLLHFANRMEGNNYEGISALRAPYKHWFYKDQFYKIDAIGIERNAVVPPVIKLLPGFSVSDVAMAKKIVENVRVNENMGVVITPEMDFEYPKNQQHYAAGTLPSIQHHDVMIARSFLAQFLNLGSTETGAFALNQSQVETFLASLQAKAAYICDVINPEIKRLVDYNYNNVESYPTLECSKMVAQNISDLADIFSKLMTGTTPLIQPTPDLADWLLNQVGAPIAPRNAVETDNPTSHATPERPQNERSGEHTDEETATVSPVTGRGSGNNVRGSKASGAGAAGVAGGDGGASAAAETGAIREETRLLTEALQAAYGFDAVERGMVFSNPNHDARGRFAAGSGGGGVKAAAGAAKAAAKGGAGSAGKAGKNGVQAQLNQAYRDWASGRAYVKNGNYRVYNVNREGYKTGGSKAATWSKAVKAAHSGTEDFHQAAMKYAAKYPKQIKSVKGLFAEPDTDSAFTLSGDGDVVRLFNPNHDARGRFGVGAGGGGVHASGGLEHAGNRGAGPSEHDVSGGAHTGGGSGGTGHGGGGASRGSGKSEGETKTTASKSRASRAPKATKSETEKSTGAKSAQKPSANEEHQTAIARLQKEHEELGAKAAQFGAGYKSLQRQQELMRLSELLDEVSR